LLLLLLLGGAAPPAVEGLLRQGNDAFRGERFDEAVDDYARAEGRALDPGLVAFNKAAALYRLGRFREAELNYRRALEDAQGPRRDRALYDLGNCLLQQAQDRDARMLEKAIDSYRACRRSPGVNPELRADAGHNLELARLLWLRAKDLKQDSSPKEDEENNADSQKNGPEDGKSEPGGNPGEPGGPQAQGKEGFEEGKGPESKQPEPGRGNLPTLPDADRLVPLPPEDVTAYLERVAERIRRERQEHWRSAAPTAPAVKDW
jgi:tetratricopeptide (TPR) repeat protein